mmetsp:Transcript_31590/g.100651  ORF Transcript_31590/g.100651 Transcript_31590/m.100651 type:complete len:243 (-) Transcript_31590:939-1667(-)
MDPGARCRPRASARAVASVRARERNRHRATSSTVDLDQQLPTSCTRSAVRGRPTTISLPRTSLPAFGSLQAREAPHPRGRAALAVHLAGAAGAVRARARRAAPRVPAAGRLYARSLPLPGAGVASGRHTRRRQGADLAADAPPGQIPRLCAATVQGRHREQGFGPGRVQLSGGGGHLFRRPAYCGRRLAQSPGTDLQLRRRVRARVWSEGPRRRTVRHAGRRDHRHGWGGAGLARRRAHCGD